VVWASFTHADCRTKLSECPVLSRKSRGLTCEKTCQGHTASKGDHQRCPTLAPQAACSSGRTTWLPCWESQAAKLCTPRVVPEPQVQGPTVFKSCLECRLAHRLEEGHQQTILSTSQKSPNLGFIVWPRIPVPSSVGRRALGRLHSLLPHPCLGVLGTTEMWVKCGGWLPDKSVTGMVLCGVSWVGSADLTLE
jgi:hypothetical protein